MNVSETPIIINYRTRRTECRCCGREFNKDESDFGELREFEFTVRGFFEWVGWTDEKRFKDEMELSADEDLAELVEEYLDNDISFFACSHEDVVQIEPSAQEKFIEAAKSEITRLLAVTA